MQNYIGVDIGGTKTAVVLGDRQGTVVRRQQFFTQTAAGPADCIRKICDIITEFTLKVRVQAIGVSCGGPLDPWQGIILSPPNLPGWDKIPLKQILTARFQIPTQIINDANAAALAEWQFGAGRGYNNMIFLTFGTGLGAGLILNGKLYGGKTDLAGEVGHIRLTEDGPMAYHKAGSFEGYCSGPGLVRLAERRLTNAALSSQPLLQKAGAASQITARDISEMAFAGDPFCLSVIAECGHYFGRGLAILIDLLNPELVVVGSMGVRLGELLFKPARAALQQEALAEAAQVCQLVPAQLGETLGDVAALCAAFYQA
ncbi:ROK family protein [candidate division KSB1 bacterium]|nr:ROK family protein [candidate division KSB1 bacterium]